MTDQQETHGPRARSASAAASHVLASAFLTNTLEFRRPESSRYTARCRPPAVFSTQLIADPPHTYRRHRTARSGHPRPGGRRASGEAQPGLARPVGGAWGGERCSPAPYLPHDDELEHPATRVRSAETSADLVLREGE